MLSNNITQFFLFFLFLQTKTNKRKKKTVYFSTPLRNSSAIHHLLFEHDLVIFGKATPKEAHSIHDCLEKYCLWSEQSINSGKSSINFSKNTNPSTIALILDVLPYTPIPANSTYLGLPIFFGNSKKYAFQNIINRVSSRMDG